MQSVVFAQDTEDIRSIKKDVFRDALFVGDSFTAKLDGLNIEKKYSAKVWATGGYTAMDLLNEVDAHKGDTPSKIILLVGINDLASMDKVEDVTINDEVNLIQALKQTFEVPIYVQLIFPTTKELLNVKPYYSLDMIQAYNEQLKTYCDQNGFLWIDTRMGLLNEEGYLAYSDDYMHIADDHYKEYLDNIALAIEVKNMNTQP